MRNRVYTRIFRKKLSKVKGKELQNIQSKITEILNLDSLDHYKNLKHTLKKFKRVHVNNSYVILFFGDDGTVYFVDYAHHDSIYKHSKKDLRKYNNLEF